MFRVPGLDVLSSEENVSALCISPKHVYFCDESSPKEPVPNC